MYALKSRGGQTCLGNFSFSSAYAYMIRKGKVAEPVRDVILAGNPILSLIRRHESQDVAANIRALNAPAA